MAKSGRKLHIYDKEKAAYFLQTNGYKAEVGENGDFLLKRISEENEKSNTDFQASERDDDYIPYNRRAVVSERDAAKKAKKKAAKQEMQLSERADSKEYSYGRFSAEDYYNDGTMYSYDFLVAQDPMQIPEMPPLSDVKRDGKIDRDIAVEEGIKNLNTVGKKSGDVYGIKNRYTNRTIYAGVNSIRHSMKGDNIGLLRTNARLSCIAGELIQNAVPINALKNENSQASGTYAMATMARSGSRYFVVIITVEQHNNVQKMEAVDITHAISGRIKTENRSASRAQLLGNESYELPRFSKINIADFLDSVKDTYRSILSVSVQNHYGKEKLKSGYYTGNVLFSERDDDYIPYNRRAVVSEETLEKWLKDYAASNPNYAQAYIEKIANTSKKTKQLILQAATLSHQRGERILQIQRSQLLHIL